MSDRFHIVKKYIDKMDYCDLLASGTPSDEFDIESKEIGTIGIVENAVYPATPAKKPRTESSWLFTYSLFTNTENTARFN